MLKLLGWLVLLSAVFGLGFYVGRHPMGELKRTVEELTRSIRDTTLGVERSMRLRQGLVDAKGQVIQAKSDLIDRNFGNAANSLTHAIEHLEQASGAERDGGGAQKIRPLIAQVKEIQLELSLGKAVKRTRLDEIQKELDVLLAK
jgi:hypothetical protein